MPKPNTDRPITPTHSMKWDRRRSPEGRRRTDGVPYSDTRINNEIVLGPFRLDDAKKKVYVNGREKHLSPKLLDLLTLLVTNHGKVLSPSQLAVNLWPANGRADPEDIKQYVYLLRKAIEPDPAKPRWLRNVRGFGYQLIIN